MAGKITVSTINDSSGVLATQNGMTGIAKAWVNFNASSGTSCVIRAAFNVSSVTYNGTGNFTVNFTTAMSDTNYCMSGSGSNEAVNTALVYAEVTARTTTALYIRTGLPNYGYGNPVTVNVIVHGN